MRGIDPNNVVVFARDGSDAVVRVGVSSWRELREVIRRSEGDDVQRFKEIDTQMARAMQSGIAPS